MRRITTVHRLVCPNMDEKEDYITACTELFWMVLTYQQDGKHQQDIRRQIEFSQRALLDRGPEFVIQIPEMVQFGVYVSREWGPFRYSDNRSYDDIEMQCREKLPQYIMMYWDQLTDRDPRMRWHFQVVDDANRLPKLKQIKELLEIIK